MTDAGRPIDTLRPIKVVGIVAGALVAICTLGTMAYGLFMFSVGMVERWDDLSRRVEATTTAVQSLTDAVMKQSQVLAEIPVLRQQRDQQIADIHAEMRANETTLTAHGDQLTSLTAVGVDNGKKLDELLSRPQRSSRAEFGDSFSDVLGRHQHHRCDAPAKPGERC